jgi:hypothetical protein
MAFHSHKENRMSTRRSFLKRSAAGAAALGVASHAHAAGDQVIRIGMIGCGGRCTAAGDQALNTGKDVRLVAMTDVFRDKVLASREHLKAKHGDQVQAPDDRCFEGLDGYKRVIEASDVVLIACASKFHPMYAEAAIKAGKHVFVEKPHGIDSLGVKRMKAVCELAREKKLCIMSGLQSRWHAGWQETIKRIHDGAIGDVVAIQAMYLRAPYQVVPRDSSWTEMQYHFRNWYHFCYLSGDDAGAQHGPRQLGAQGGDAGLGVRPGRPVRVVRQPVRRHVRPPHRGLRVRQRGPRLRDGHHAGEPLPPLRRNHHGHARHLRPGRVRHRRPGQVEV